MSIELHIGPMHSGKTSALLHITDKLWRQGEALIFIKHHKDKRYSATNVIAHNKLSLSIDKQYLRDANSLSEVKIDGIKIIIIDELNAFSDWETVLKWRNSGLRIIAAGLSSNFMAQPFESVERLILHANKVKKYSAVCKKCSSPALYTSYIGADTGLDPTAFNVGGEDIYEVRCADHFVFPNGEYPFAATKHVVTSQTAQNEIGLHEYINKFRSEISAKLNANAAAAEYVPVIERFFNYPNRVQNELKTLSLFYEKNLAKKDNADRFQPFEIKMAKMNISCLRGIVPAFTDVYRVNRDQTTGIFSCYKATSAPKKNAPVNVRARETKNQFPAISDAEVEQYKQMIAELEKNKDTSSGRWADMCDDD